MTRTDLATLTVALAEFSAALTAYRAMPEALNVSTETFDAASGLCRALAHVESVEAVGLTPCVADYAARLQGETVDLLDGVCDLLWCDVARDVETIRHTLTEILSDLPVRVWFGHGYVRVYVNNAGRGAFLPVTGGFGTGSGAGIRSAVGGDAAATLRTVRTRVIEHYRKELGGSPAWKPVSL